MKKVVIEALSPLRGSVNYLKELRDLSRKNRNNPTEAEEKIWKELLRKKKTGFTFLRQKPIDRFIVDFYCSELNLAIEIDGSSHDKKSGYDQSRDKFLKQIGVKTIRFTNNQILFQINQVKNILDISLVKGRVRGIKIKSPLSKGETPGNCRARGIKTSQGGAKGIKFTLS